MKEITAGEMTEVLLLNLIEKLKDALTEERLSELLKQA